MTLSEEIQHGIARLEAFSGKKPYGVKLSREQYFQLLEELNTTSLNLTDMKDGLVKIYGVVIMCKEETE